LNDHRDPQWPTGDDPDAGRRQEQSQESTGVWSPSFDDDDDDDAGQPQWPTKAPAERPTQPPASQQPTARQPRPVMGRPSGQVPSPAGGPPRPPGPPGRPPAGRGQRPPMPPGGGRPPMPPGGPGEQRTVVVRKPGAPGPGPDQPTDLLTPLHNRSRTAAEPQLLTHREFEDPVEYEDPDSGYEDPDSFYDEPVLSDEEVRRRRRRKVWRRVRRSSYVFMAVMIIAPLAAFFVAYQIVDVPDPKALAADLDKTVTVEWGDGSQFTTIAPNGRRTLVSPQDIPEHVRRAVYAAEDNTFETNDGFDIKGILNAALKNLTGGTGGGSTITQQYVKKATGDEQKTLTRKFMELATAYKMSNTMDKDDIITAYLNTIYFGRRANGIAAAAKAYYNVDDVKQLTQEQAATLAGVIQQPGRAAGDPEWVQERWNYVMDKMVEQGWYAKDKRATVEFPVPMDPDAGNQAMQPDMRLIWEQAKRELDANGISEETLNKKGYKVSLTIDKGAQEAAKNAISEVMAGQPANLRQALVAVDPNTGRVLAYYGYNQAKNGYDYARAWQNPGSSFKAFDLVALLHDGKGLGEVYDGTSPRKFGKDCDKANAKCSTIANSENTNACGKQCTVAKAMELSINTVFADIAYNEVGLKSVAKAAIEAGLPPNVGNKKIPLEGTDEYPLNINISIGGDVYQARPIDMAGAYATFADGGTRRAPHVVSKVVDPNNNNNVILDLDGQTATGEAAFSKTDPEENAKIARNVTESLLPVVGNNAKLKCADGRICAGKTGTHGCSDVPGKTKKSDNCAAWMVGYTPQIASAVWVGTDDNTPVRNKEGKAVFGSGLSGEVWKKFMDSYLKGKEKAKFSPYKKIGKSADEAVITTENTSRSSSQQPTTTTTQTQTTTSTETNAPPTTTSKTTTTSKSTPGDPDNPGGENRNGG
jgi:membrane peptidoglycan carboxypeptidase